MSPFHKVDIGQVISSDVVRAVAGIHCTDILAFYGIFLEVIDRNYADVFWSLGSHMEENEVKAHRRMGLSTHILNFQNGHFHTHPSFPQPFLCMHICPGTIFSSYVLLWIIIHFGPLVPEWPSTKSHSLHFWICSLMIKSEFWSNKIRLRIHIFYFNKSGCCNVNIGNKWHRMDMVESWNLTFKIDNICGILLGRVNQEWLE